MEQTPIAPANPPAPNNRRMLYLVGGGVGALVLLCLCVPICVIAILAILGPQIGNVFSRVTNGLSR